MNKNFTYSTTRKFNPERYEKNSGEVMTVPDQSYTLRDIVTRYKRGQALPQIAKTSIFEDDDVDVDDDINPLRLPDRDLSDITLMQSELEELAKQKERSGRERKQPDITAEKTGAADDVGGQSDSAN